MENGSITVTFEIRYHAPSISTGLGDYTFTTWSYDWRLVILNVYKLYNIVNMNVDVNIFLAFLVLKSVLNVYKDTDRLIQQNGVYFTPFLL